MPKEITKLGIYDIGPTPDAKVQIFDASAYGGFVTATHASIFFVDALGNRRIYPAVGAGSEIAVGKDDC